MYQKLFDLMHETHDVILLESEINDIIDTVNECEKTKLAIAKELIRRTLNNYQAKLDVMNTDKDKCITERSEPVYVASIISITQKRNLLKWVLKILE
jgi:hypothetical protein